MAGRHSELSSQRPPALNEVTTTHAPPGRRKVREGGFRRRLAVPRLDKDLAFSVRLSFPALIITSLHSNPPSLVSPTPTIYHHPYTSHQRPTSHPGVTGGAVSLGRASVSSPAPAPSPSPHLTSPLGMSRAQQDQFIDDDEEETCPLCVEEFDLADKGFPALPLRIPGMSQTTQKNGLEKRV